ncbi:MAG: hypothetical protein WD793_02265 [Steroidobacteraceae bacterium]
MTESSRDLTPPPAPTVTSNQQAAALACATERNRVLDILATAAPPVDAALVAAIEGGTPAAIHRTRQRLAPSDADNPSQGRRGASVWGAVTARINAEQRAAREASTESGS